jgi:hypothetical protein
VDSPAIGRRVANKLAANLHFPANLFQHNGAAKACAVTKKRELDERLTATAHVARNVRMIFPPRFATYGGHSTDKAIVWWNKEKERTVLELVDVVAPLGINADAGRRRDLSQPQRTTPAVPLLGRALDNITLEHAAQQRPHMSLYVIGHECGAGNTRKASIIIDEYDMAVILLMG